MVQKQNLLLQVRREQEMKVLGIDRHTNNKEIGVSERKKFKSMEFLFERPLSIQLEGLQAQTKIEKIHLVTENFISNLDLVLQRIN